MSSRNDDAADRLPVVQSADASFVSRSKSLAELWKDSLREFKFCHTRGGVQLKRSRGLFWEAGKKNKA
jgi:hypothetical protein